MNLLSFDRDAFDKLLRDGASTARAVLEGVAERTANTRAVLWP
jgi:hypothetical protein